MSSPAQNTVLAPVLSAAAPGSHAIAAAVDLPVLIALVVAALAGAVWLIWKMARRSR